jgi:hypothetical protein
LALVCSEDGDTPSLELQSPDPPCELSKDSFPLLESSSERVL